MNRTKIYLIIYLLVLISIPIITFLLRDKLLVNKPQTPVASAKSLSVASVASTPIPTPIPTIAISQATTQPAAKKTTLTAVPGPKVAGIPVRIKIPKIGMNAAVEQVGMDADGTMSVPKSWWTVGWYSLGFKIGDNGSAVFSGHYDTNTGAPAVFYSVSRLLPGDTITVTNSNGSVYNFRVIRKEAYPYDQMPMQSIFASSGNIGLNLITCSGTWDRATSNYSQRTVVYAIAY